MAHVFPQEIRTYTHSQIWNPKQPVVNEWKWWNTYPPWNQQGTWKSIFWNTIVSFWGPAYFQGQTVSFREGIFVSCNYLVHHPIDSQPLKLLVFGVPGIKTCFWGEYSPVTFESGVYVYRTFICSKLAKRELQMKVSSSFPCFYCDVFWRGGHHLIAKLMEKWTFEPTLKVFLQHILTYFRFPTENHGVEYFLIAFANLPVFHISPPENNTFLRSGRMEFFHRQRNH